MPPSRSSRPPRQAGTVLGFLAHSLFPRYGVPGEGSRWNAVKTCVLHTVPVHLPVLPPASRSAVRMPVGHDERGLLVAVIFGVPLPQEPVRSARAFRQWAMTIEDRAGTIERKASRRCSHCKRAEPTTCPACVRDQRLEQQRELELLRWDRRGASRTSTGPLLLVPARAGRSTKKIRPGLPLNEFSCIFPPIT